MEKKKVTDAECIAEWRTMISTFNELVKESPSIESVREDLLQLRDMAKNNNLLNFRQTEAIVARCENYLAGKYGNTKTTLQMSQTKTGFAKAS